MMLPAPCFPSGMVCLGIVQCWFIAMKPGKGQMSSKWKAVVLIPASLRIRRGNSFIRLTRRNFSITAAPNKQGKKQETQSCSGRTKSNNTVAESHTIEVHSKIHGRLSYPVAKVHCQCIGKVFTVLAYVVPT
ncbi:hypothetical protein GOODEAATRI_028984 [Goodea atripinnis]|uniref:Secreted protein n=1 Tax=Goodea atripinnis TaxID=208336 RepID=A0ABV0NEK8_9TELE